MCGFVGCLIDWIKVDNVVYDQIIYEMIKMIVYWGFDDDGYFVDDNIIMGFWCLSIIDLVGGY